MGKDMTKSMAKRAGQDWLAKYHETYQGWEKAELCWLFWDVSEDIGRIAAHSRSGSRLRIVVGGRSFTELEEPAAKFDDSSLNVEVSMPSFQYYGAVG
ncbi:hypothetical protein E4U52_003187 [Claviceps spartinae]|nr:hypothetical protein E4U52_003187 [Claviceps spartinae]